MLYKFFSWYTLLNKHSHWLTAEQKLVISTQGRKKETLQWTAATLWQSLVSGIGQTYWLYFVSESWQQWWHVKVVIVNVCRPQWIGGSVMVTAKKSAHSPTWTLYSCRYSIWFSKTARTVPTTVTFVAVPVCELSVNSLWIVCELSVNRLLPFSLYIYWSMFFYTYFLLIRTTWTNWLHYLLSIYWSMFFYTYFLLIRTTWTNWMHYLLSIYFST